MLGRSLRQYRISASVGRGGMGEVWLGRDTSLERDVAIKTLPVSTDADAATRKERFFREARAASALNHPNIITIYEINADQGIDFIAMEYVEGQTLADMMQHGPLAFDLVRRIAQQIADGVGRAHRAGIVHRDLKPRNIMVTTDGLVKVLDFGLAKLTRAGESGSGAHDVTQAALTRVGTTVGTLGYMSPEQAIGDAVDARSDVFSFGVILYEMLTGRLPFAGKTMSEILHELHFAEPPALDTLRADVPASLRRVVTKALQKKPDDRFPHMGEVASALSGADRSDAAPTVVAAAAPPVAPRTGWRLSRLALVGLFVFLIAGIATVTVRRSRARAAAGVMTANTPSPPTVMAPPPAAPTAPPTTPAKAPVAPPVDRRAIQIDPKIAAKANTPDLESRRALALVKSGDRQAALTAIDNVARRQNLTAPVLFRTAIVYELAGARPRALLSLGRALRAGYPLQDVEADPALAALRTDPRYKRMIEGAPARKGPARRVPPR